MGFASVLIVMLKSFITGTATMVASHTTRNKIQNARLLCSGWRGYVKAKAKRGYALQWVTAEDPGPRSIMMDNTERDGDAFAVPAARLPIRNEGHP